MDTRFLLVLIDCELRRLVQSVRTEGDRGDAAEKVVTIAAMVALAIGVMAIIATKVLGKTNSISF
jgi:hypothetical protein